MSKRAKVDGKEMGLLIGLIAGRYFLKTDELHYGYWPEGLAVCAENLPRAQANLSHFIISHIPEGTKSVLDVGCGAGNLARKLVDRGYEVDCISPSPLLAGYARNKLGNGTRIIECEYERFVPEDCYDLVLFCESFQYVDMNQSILNSLRCLNEGGHLLICDFFKTDAKAKSVLSGGHRLSKFYDLAAKYPLDPVLDLDITPETAPTMTVVHELLQEVGVPIREMASYFLDNNHPRISRLLKWKYKKKIAKLDFKYFSGQRNARNFSLSKSYRFLLYRKNTESSFSQREE
ncbi:MAG: class I SAM-dependent methyltransferase [bacterium]